MCNNILACEVGMVKKALLIFLVSSQIAFAQYDNIVINFNNNENQLTQNTNNRYDYVYSNPPRQSLDAWGRYIYSNSTVRYVQSPSRLKRAAHAARIDAYNRMYE